MNLFSWLPGFNKNSYHGVSKKRAFVREGRKNKKQVSERRGKDYVQAINQLTAAVNGMRDELVNVVSLNFPQIPENVDEDAEMSPAPDIEEHNEEPVDGEPVDEEPVDEELVDEETEDEEPVDVEPMDNAISLVPETVESEEGSTGRDYDTEQLMAWIYKDIHVASLPERIVLTRKFGKLLAAEARNFSFNSWIKMNIALHTVEMFKVIQYATRRFSSSPNSLRDHISAAVDLLSDGTDSLGRRRSIVEEERDLILRYGRFASKYGWMMLSILANSAAFREAARTLEEVRWSTLCDCICENRNSIEVFAKSRELNWEAALKQRQDFDKWTHFRNEQYPYLKIPKHPHELIVPAGAGPLKNPRYQGRNQVNYPDNLYDAADFESNNIPRGWPRGVNYPSDPTDLLYKLGRTCELCSQHDCKCDLNTHPSIIRPLVELMQYDGKGVGIRALQPILNNMPLGEYVGEIHHPRSTKDHEGTYALAIQGPSRDNDMVGIINARYQGNWTRYINHSCDPNAQFSTMLIGRKQRSMIKTVKAVAMFEELTIHYGDDYWVHRKFLCRCGSSNCRFSTWAQLEELKKLTTAI